MFAYIIRRLLLIIPTLFGIMVLNFAIIQFVPGGPVEQTIAKLQGNAMDPTARLAGGTGAGDFTDENFNAKQGGLGLQLDARIQMAPTKPGVA